MKKLPFAPNFLALTTSALAIAWFWGLSPLGSLSGLRQTNWTAADTVDHRVPIHFVNPHGITGKDDFDIEIKWGFAETKVRLAVVFITLLAATTYLNRQRNSRN